MLHDKPAPGDNALSRISSRASEASEDDDGTRAPGIAGAIARVNAELAIAEQQEQRRREQLGYGKTWEEKKMGRPTKYEEWMPGAILELYSRPDIVVTKKLIANHFLMIGEVTFYDWMKKHKQLSEAVRAGECLQEARLASRMASGIKYPQSIFAVLKNLHHWTDKVEETHKIDFQDALAQAQQHAKRVQWDGVAPAPVAPPAPTLPVIDVSPQQEAK